MSDIQLTSLVKSVQEVALQKDQSLLDVIIVLEEEKLEQTKVSLQFSKLAHNVVDMVK